HEGERLLRRIVGFVDVRALVGLDGPLEPLLRGRRAIALRAVGRAAPERDRAGGEAERTKKHRGHGGSFVRGWDLRDRLDREDSVTSELASAARGEQIAENSRWVEIGSHAGDPHGERLGAAVRGPVADDDVDLLLTGVDRRGDHLRARVALADPD